MKHNILAEKSELFAVRIVMLTQYLVKEKSEYILSKQLLRSGTSIGANIVEASEAFSKKDFLAKLSISLKESAETNYWLRLLYKTQLLGEEDYKSMSADCSEIYRMLIAAIKTTRISLQNQL